MINKAKEAKLLKIKSITQAVEIIKSKIIENQKHNIILCG